MVHIKWVIALVVTAVLSVAATYYATEKYVTERMMGQLSEISIMRNTTYAILTKEIEDGKHDEAKIKLRKMFDMELKEIQRTKGVMENSYLASANSEYIDRINRYLASPRASADK
ncbi:MAG: hypothetical protein Q7S71_04155 [Candidatus Nitrotoga sp.]|nr:hypothetical protein [Candidatus Nitrotoga sp.]